MEKVIYKYQLSKRWDGIIELPKDAVIVSFAFQNEAPTIWAEVIAGNEKEKRHFVIIPTGMPIEIDAKHLFTTHIDGYVWHLYETTT